MDTQTVNSNPETIARDFWENDLQMCLDVWLKNAANASFMKNWIGDLTKCQLRTLCSVLGLETSHKLEPQRSALASCNGQLTPYYLVERFAYRRSKFAIIDYSARVFPDETLASFRSGEGEGEYDTLALLFQLYHSDPTFLKNVFHLEKVHANGFARMKLSTEVRRPSNQTFREFLTPKVVQELLANFDAKRNDGRGSELMNIIPDSEHPVVFIRREEQRTMLLKSRDAIHGFKPDWVILDFHDNGKGVDISSHSISVPVEIANHIASAYFGTKCEYENVREVTYKKLIDKFLNLLKHDGIGFLKLVEVHVKNSPLEGAPVVKISSEADESVAEGVRHFEKAIGSLLANINLIKTVKTLYNGKRVKLTFEPVEGVAEGYDVRYTDKVLNKRERRAFEEKVRNAPYGLRISSTEKRHKQRAGR